MATWGKLSDFAGCHRLLLSSLTSVPPEAIRATPGHEEQADTEKTRLATSCILSSNSYR